MSTFFEAIENARKNNFIFYYLEFLFFWIQKETFKIMKVKS